MADQGNFKVTCPHCRALIEIDPEHMLAVGGEAPAAPKEGLSFDERMKKLEEDKKNAQTKFEESVRAEKNKKEVLEKKFRELAEKAKDDNGIPMKRDIDLD